MNANIRRASSVFLVLFSLSSLAATEGVVATVGAKKITIEEFNRRYDEVKEKTLNPPPKEIFLEDLVRYEMGVQEAEKKAVQNDPVVAERLRQELYKGLIEKELGEKMSKIDIKEEELKKYYEKTPEVRTSHILVELKPNATDKDRAAAKKNAEEILGKVLKSDKSFEELVKLYSDDSATKESGGDIGWQTPLTVVPEYYKAAESLKKDQIYKKLVETRYGFHIVKLTGRNSYEQANKRQIRAAVFDEKRKKMFDEYFAKLKSQYKIELNKSALK